MSPADLSPGPAGGPAPDDGAWRDPDQACAAWPDDPRRLHRVARLRLRLPAGGTQGPAATGGARWQQAVEDALRCAATGADRRIVLLRQLRVRGSASDVAAGAAAWQARMEEACQAAVRGARHGRDPAAANAAAGSAAGRASGCVPGSAPDLSADRSADRATDGAADWAAVWFADWDEAVAGWLDTAWAQARLGAPAAGAGSSTAAGSAGIGLWFWQRIALMAGLPRAEVAASAADAQALQVVARTLWRRWAADPASERARRVWRQERPAAAAWLGLPPGGTGTPGGRAAATEAQGGRPGPRARPLAGWQIDPRGGSDRNGEAATLPPDGLAAGPQPSEALKGMAVDGGTSVRAGAADLGSHGSLAAGGRVPGLPGSSPDRAGLGGSADATMPPAPQRASAPGEPGAWRARGPAHASSDGAGQGTAQGAAQGATQGPTPAPSAADAHGGLAGPGSATPADAAVPRRAPPVDGPNHAAPGDAQRNAPPMRGHTDQIGRADALARNAAPGPGAPALPPGRATVPLAPRVQTAGDAQPGNAQPGLHGPAHTDGQAPWGQPAGPYAAPGWAEIWPSALSGLPLCLNALAQLGFEQVLGAALIPPGSTAPASPTHPWAALAASSPWLAAWARLPQAARQRLLSDPLAAAWPVLDGVPLQHAAARADAEAHLLAQWRAAPPVLQQLGRQAWRALNRACRQQGWRGARALLLRPGWVALNATHLDLLFPLNAADTTVRRLGLDQNPGWLPWWGRIVQIHYLPAADLPPWPATTPGGPSLAPERPLP